MEDSKTQDEVTIIDKDANSEKVLSVVDGFVIEESVNPFPVSLHLSLPPPLLFLPLILHACINIIFWFPFMAAFSHYKIQLSLSLSLTL